MQDWLQPRGDLDIVGLVIGAALLLFGRRLYWLALGAAAFYFGLLLAPEIAPRGDEAWQLGMALILGLAGIVFAFVAQKLAVGIGGLMIGALGGLWLAQPWQADLGPWFWAIPVIGALIGGALASMVFDLALIVLSAWMGATIATSALPVESPMRTWILLGLVVFGFVFQTRSGRRPRI